MANELVQLRLPPGEVADLRETAKDARRTLQEEIRHRLLSYRTERPSGVEQALGDLATLVATSANEALAYDQRPKDTDASKNYRARLLGVVRDGFAAVLNELGALKATELPPHEGADGAKIPLAQWITWPLAGKIMRAPIPISQRFGRSPAGDPERDTSTEGRIGKALGFREAEATKSASPQANKRGKAKS